ncbi:MAG TPA: hypothetical protein VGF84_00945 [Micromonosporaceae bacterium]
MDYRFDAPQPGDSWLPAEVSIDEALDLAERPGHFDEDSSATLQAEFDRRFDGAPLTPTQRGRYAAVAARGKLLAGDPAGAESAWRSALEIFAAAHDNLRWHKARGRFGVLLCATKRVDEGLPLAVESANYVLAHGEPTARFGVYLNLAGAYAAGGRDEDALASLHRAAGLVDLDFDPRAQARLLVQRSKVLAKLNHTDARSSADAALAACRATGFRHGWAIASLVASRLEYTRGDKDTALAFCEDALAVAVHGSTVQGARRMRAILLAATDRAGEVIDDLIDEAAAADATGQPAVAELLRRLLAGVYSKTDRPAEAVELLINRVSAADPLDASAEPRRIVLAEAFTRLGEHGPAASQYDIVAASAMHRGDVSRAARAYDAGAKACAAMLQHDLAAARFHRAADAYLQAELALASVRAGWRGAAEYLTANDHKAATRLLGTARQTVDRFPLEDPEARRERAFLADVDSKLREHLGKLDAAIELAAYAASELYALEHETAAALAAVRYGRLLVTARRWAEAEHPLRWALATNVGAATQPAASLLVNALWDLGRRDEAKRIARENRLAIK